MIRSLASAIMLLVAACAPQEDEGQQANGVANASQQPAMPKDVPTLEGKWRLAAVDGKPIGAAEPMTVEFDGGQAIVAAGCLRRAWTYTQARNVVSFATNAAGSANCGGRSPSAEQESAYAAVDQATMAIFSENGTRADLSGSGGNVALERR